MADKCSNSQPATAAEGTFKVTSATVGGSVELNQVITILVTWHGNLQGPTNN